MAAPSFPDVHVTGAVHHYIQVRGDTNIYYLGTAEITPQMQREKVYQNVLNDIGGKTLPFQKTYDGEHALVSVLLTRFSRTAWDFLLRSGEASGVTMPGFSGVETRISRGHAVYGRSDFKLWQVFDFALFPQVASANLEIGWAWPQVVLQDHDTMAAGTQAEKLMLVFDCQAQWLGAGNGFALYTNDPADFPADVLVPQ
jgi:hypothetical protein